MHTHRAAPRGRIVSARIDHHPEKPADDVTIGKCGVCGEMVWLTPRAVLFMRYRPTWMLMCCVCNHGFEHFAREVAPEAVDTWLFEPVPDLSYMLN